MTATSFASNDRHDFANSISGYISNKAENYYFETYSFLDSLGDEYNITFEKIDSSTETAMYDSNGFLVSKSLWRKGDNYITNTYKLSNNSKKNVNIVTETIKIIDYIINDQFLEINTINYGNELNRDNIPRTNNYTFHKTYNTDYTYQGQILKGDGYYRKVGSFNEYNRMSYKFQRNMTITAIFTIISVGYSFITGTTKILYLAGGMGIGVVGSAITTDWNVNCSVRSFSFDFKCLMKYQGRNISTCEIRRNLEYLYGKDPFSTTESYVYDSWSYNDPMQAINSFCSEAVGYGAQAFSVKYILGHDPNLSLPVSGPVW